VKKITLRQRQILILLAEGMTSKEIAALIDVSERTIRSEIAALMPLLGAQSHFFLALRAFHEGFLPAKAGYCANEKMKFNGGNVAMLIWRQKLQALIALRP